MRTTRFSGAGAAVANDGNTGVRGGSPHGLKLLCSLVDMSGVQAVEVRRVS